MSYTLRRNLRAQWASIPELAPADPFLAEIAIQAEEGLFNPATLDALLSDMVLELEAVHTARDLERALGAASRMLMRLEQHAQGVRARKFGNYNVYPPTTIAEVIAKRGMPQSIGRVVPKQERFVDLNTSAPPAAPWRAVQPASPPESSAPIPSSKATEAVVPHGEPHAMEAVIAGARAIGAGLRGAVEEICAPLPKAQPVPMAATAPTVPRFSTPSAQERGVLDGQALGKSIVPTWLALVGLSWVSLIWGGIISAPFGVGAAVLGGAVGGIFAVPLWATIFGFMGMGGARKSTLKEMGFKACAPDEPLANASRRFAESLGIKAPEIGTMEPCNAFAMGTDRNDATVALGRPLLEMLTEAEAEAVLGHEIGHVVSGDMKRMMLMRTFQNATVWYMVAQGAKQFVRWVICWGAELYILAFSRKREYWADAIGAALTSKEAMIGALSKFATAPPLTDAENTHARFMVRGRISGAFSTHPSFEDRIVALQHETYLRQLPHLRT